MPNRLELVVGQYYVSFLFAQLFEVLRFFESLVSGPELFIVPFSGFQTRPIAQYFDSSHAQLSTLPPPHHLLPSDLLPPWARGGPAKHDRRLERIGPSARMSKYIGFLIHARRLGKIKIPAGTRTMY